MDAIDLKMTSTMNLHLAQPIYTAQTIQAWEQRWFAQGNSSYGLMQQAAWLMAVKIFNRLDTDHCKQHHCNILLWCGRGNNAGDGYLIAQYLFELFQNKSNVAPIRIMIFAPQAPSTPDAVRARQTALDAKIPLMDEIEQLKHVRAQVHIDALFGIGLSRMLSQSDQDLIALFNAQSGYKISVDLPSGLHPDTGQAMPIAVRADWTLCLLGLKLGVLIGQGKAYVGELQCIDLIPRDHALESVAQIDFAPPHLPKRSPFAHKGDFGHVLVVGGHRSMGGAVIMAAESAMATGAGKLTVLCHGKHHAAILARSPNIMVLDIDLLTKDQLHQLLSQVDTVCFGMGLGRDDWAKQHVQNMFDGLFTQYNRSKCKDIVLDADALWWLAEWNTPCFPLPLHFPLPPHLPLPPHFIMTPHSAEAGRLLGCTATEIEADRVKAIQELHQSYGGAWVLKGAASLSLAQDRLNVCAFGNAGMATAGMGDVLAGMVAGLKAQFSDDITLAEVVALHALAGDILAEQGERGLQAHQMKAAIYQVVNAG